MQTTSALYKQIFKIPTHKKEVYADIAGEKYGENRIVSLATSGGIFSEPDIGNCASRQIDLVLRETGAIPRQAKIKVFVRLVSGDLASEWIQKGEFYISTRKKDKRTGRLTIHGFDAMLRASDVWLTPEYDTENWPMSQTAAVGDIAFRMGVPVDNRTWTNLKENFPVDYPVGENGDLTMTDILEGIAIANAGNWIISDKGALLFWIHFTTSISLLWTSHDARRRFGWWSVSHRQVGQLNFKHNAVHAVGAGINVCNPVLSIGSDSIIGQRCYHVDSPDMCNDLIALLNHIIGIIQHLQQHFLSLPACGLFVMLFYVPHDAIINVVLRFVNRFFQISEKI